MSERDQIRRHVILGFGIIIAVFGGVFLWSFFAPFHGAVIASGAIIVESQHKAIQHLEGGLVHDILVKEGDSVEANELLVRLDGATLNAKLSSLEARLIDHLAREARLVAELQGGELSLRRVDGLMRHELLERSLQLQNSILVARAQSRATQISILNRKIDQLSYSVSGMQAEAASKTKQGATIKEELAALESLFDRGLVSKTRILALRRELLNIEGAQDALTAKMAQAEVQVGEAELEIMFLKDGFREAVSTELSTVVVEINSMVEERTGFLDQRRRLDIRSPSGGKVFGIRTNTIGGVIAPGDPLMFIVPGDNRFVAMVRIASGDIDKVYLGQEARLRFSAFSNRQSPEVVGEVIGLSADAKTDPQLGVVFYDGQIAFEAGAKELNALKIIPGMPVEVLLTTDGRNALSYLTKPARDVMAITFRD